VNGSSPSAIISASPKFACLYKCMFILAAAADAGLLIDPGRPPAVELIKYVPQILISELQVGSAITLDAICSYPSWISLIWRNATHSFTIGRSIRGMFLMGELSTAGGLVLPQSPYIIFAALCRRVRLECRYLSCTGISPLAPIWENEAGKLLPDTTISASGFTSIILSISDDAHSSCSKIWFDHPTSMNTARSPDGPRLATGPEGSQSPRSASRRLAFTQ
jgi:hypothetical protein